MYHFRWESDVCSSLIHSRCSDSQVLVLGNNFYLLASVYHFTFAEVIPAIGWTPELFCFETNNIFPWDHCFDLGKLNFLFLSQPKLLVIRTKSFQQFEQVVQTYKIFLQFSNYSNWNYSINKFALLQDPENEV